MTDRRQAKHHDNPSVFIEWLAASPAMVAIGKRRRPQADEETQTDRATRLPGDEAREEPAVCEMVEQVFGKLVEPDYEPEGVAEFFRFADPSAMAERIRIGGFVLVARDAERLVGMPEFAPPDRIAMLFVTRRRQGIATELLVRAIEKARAEIAAVSKLTVHSSPYDQAAYRRMGFRQSGRTRTDHGIRYTPMESRVESGKAL